MTTIERQFKKAQQASRLVAQAPLSKRNTFLSALRVALKKNKRKILLANNRDIRALERTDHLADRLRLTEARLASAIHDIGIMAKKPDPLGQIREQKTLANGLRLKKTTVPLGVLGIIYESRPNVTLDSACLAIKAGNACVLKGGRESTQSNKALVSIIKQCLTKAGLPSDAVSYLDQGRSAVQELLHADTYVDVIIPRGGAGLISFVRKNATVPVIETGAGVCHTYIDQYANLEQGAYIAHNAKVSRPTVCNALDTLLIHHTIAKKYLTLLAPLLAADDVVIHADKKSYALLTTLDYPHLQRASKKDFGKEFLSLAMAIQIVPSLDAAMDHIAHYSSKHSEAIVSQNKKNCKTFTANVDAACVYSNASTRFTDGAEFDLGGEIGISTQKLHARGPLGLSELTSYKWIITGSGQIR